MGDLLIRNLPDRLHAQLNERARSSGRSLSDEAKDLLRKGLREPERAPQEADLDTFDLLRQPFLDALLTEDEHRKLMEATSESRRHASRDVPDFE